MKGSGNSAPGTDEVEISIFGPGKGESIAVHFGQGKWMIVDSCVDQVGGDIPVLSYLDRIGVDVPHDVLLVVGTHAHDDHIAGLARVFKVCENASFVCSSAATNDEFYALVSEDEELEKLLRLGVYSEYRQIFEIAKTRRGRPKGRRPLIRGIESLDLLPFLSGAPNDLNSLIALSPSQDALDRGQTALADGAAQEGNRRRLRSLDPNLFAVALWVHVGNRHILLGADLLSGPQGCGWRGVLDWYRPSQKAEVVKVPHHGAPNAHLDEMWSELMSEQPIAMLAPYRAGVTPRPSTEDQKRLTAFAEQVYITASPDHVAPPKAVRREAAVMNQLARNVRIWGRSGQVQARANLSGGNPWSVQTFPPASRLA